MVQRIRDLKELAHQGGTVRATCRECQRVSLFTPWELSTYFLTRRWDDSWPAFALKLRCSGCGANNPLVVWTTGEPPPPEPSPPKPRAVRSNAPKGADVVPLRKRRA